LWIVGWYFVYPEMNDSPVDKYSLVMISFNCTWIFHYEKIFFFFLIIILYLFAFCIGCRAKVHLLDQGVVLQLEMKYVWVLVCILLQIFHFMISFLVEMTMPWRLSLWFLCFCGIMNLIFTSVTVSPLF